MHRFRKDKIGTKKQVWDYRLGRACVQGVMKRIRRFLSCFSKTDILIWLSSIVLIIVPFLIFDRENFMTLTASLVGVTALIICAKGLPVGQVLMIAFCTFYGIISYKMAYYGEMLTYMCMTGPMAIFALVSWLKNPFQKGKAEVKVSKISTREYLFLAFLTIAVTAIFYFVLKYFNTANLIPSTISIATSFVAVYLTFRRCEYFYLAYAANDVVLIVLWVLATLTDISYISVITCFAVFLINDIYGFCSWKKIKNRQGTKGNENTYCQTR